MRHENVQLLRKMAQPRLVAVIFCILGFLLKSQEATSWKAPPEARKMKNPVPMTGEGLAAIAPFYERNCLRCHGASGVANGPDAHSLPVTPANLADAKALKGITDGELFWKISTGRAPMEPFTQLSTTERWQLVNYVRDLVRRSQYRYLGTKLSR
jgi:mono/diheme cytochrome c family protein